MHIKLWNILILNIKMRERAENIWSLSSLHGKCRNKQKIRPGKPTGKYLNSLLDILYSEHVTVALFFMLCEPCAF